MSTSQPGRKSTPRAADKLIVALDVNDKSAARAIVGELRAEVGAFKIGLELFTSAGPAFVEKLVSEGVKIFLDLKFHDIPNTVAGAAASAAKLGVWMFNVHALGGREMMLRAVESARETSRGHGLERPLVIGVSVLTSSDQKTLTEIGIERTVDAEVLSLAGLCHDCGLDGVVASAIEAAAIKKLPDTGGFVVVTPGIRPNNATNDDQKRVMTPGGAVAAGSDYLVVGRSVIGQPDRVGAVRSIIAEIETVIK